MITAIKGSSQLIVIDKDNFKHVGEIKGARFLASMDYLIKGVDTTYYLSFRNHRHKALRRISVIEFKEGKTLIDAYELFNEFIKDTAIKSRKFILGNTPIIVMNHWGWSNLKLIIKTPYGYFKINPEQLETLFGRKK